MVISNVLQLMDWIDEYLCRGQLAVSLAITSACRQKKHHIMHHMKFTEIHQNFMSTISYTIHQYLMIIYATDYSQLTIASLFQSTKSTSRFK